jgi:2,4-dienoyl-CoA reductase-like NADH-dependent reductase (Old Yellow Enzyme family)
VGRTTHKYHSVLIRHVDDGQRGCCSISAKIRDAEFMRAEDPNQIAPVTIDEYLNAESPCPDTTEDEEVDQSIPTQLRSPSESLFSSTYIGDVELANRVALAPMTRVSATGTGVPTERMRSYYRAFAEGGFALLITEGTYIDEGTSQGYFFQPGIANSAQSAAWRGVVDGVHAVGAKFFAQLMHAGSQSQGNAYTTTTWGPSAIRPKGEQLGMYRGSGPFQTPEPMTTEHISLLRTAFVNAARHARDAGFDGVEIHGANGYLLDAFLTDYLNTRTDDYGGSILNRVRLATEVCRDVVAAVGDEVAVGIRVSQGKVADNNHRWAGGEDEAAVIFNALADTGIDYIHTTEYRSLAPAFGEGTKTLAGLCKLHSGLSVIVNGNLDDPRDAAAIIESGEADVVALGKPALANRDWPRRVRAGQPLSPDVPADLFGPVADIKDWEIANNHSSRSGT